VALIHIMKKSIYRDVSTYEWQTDEGSIGYL